MSLETFKNATRAMIARAEAGIPGPAAMLTVSTLGGDDATGDTFNFPLTPTEAGALLTVLMAIEAERHAYERSWAEDAAAAMARRAQGNTPWPAAAANDNAV